MMVMVMIIMVMEEMDIAICRWLNHKTVGYFAVHCYNDKKWYITVFMANINKYIAGATVFFVLLCGCCLALSQECYCPEWPVSYCVWQIHIFDIQIKRKIKLLNNISNGLKWCGHMQFLANSNEKHENCSASFPARLTCMSTDLPLTVTNSLPFLLIVAIKKVDCT